MARTHAAERCVTCAVTSHNNRSSSLLVHAVLVAMQLCGKHILRQYATMEEDGVFCEVRPKATEWEFASCQLEIATVR
jgi:hypothetical protein